MDLKLFGFSYQEKPAKADELLLPSITIRKLINRIELYSPMDKKKYLVKFGTVSFIIYI